MRYFVAIVTLVLGLLIAGCSDNSMTASPAGRLYFAVPAGGPAPPAPSGEVFNLGNASAANGTVNPTVISGVSTHLFFPGYIALDQKADRLFVNDGSSLSILVFERVSTRSGNAAPDRVISGNATTFATMGPIAVDAERDVLYAANGTNPDGSVNILAFANASTVNGNVAPTRTLKVGAVGFLAVGMTLDQANDRLFVSNSGEGIDVYDGVSSLPTGPATPNRTISGPHTGLFANSGVVLDGAGRLLVCNEASGLGATSPTITIYANAATANGDVAPVATIVGANTGLNEPFAMAVNNSPGPNDNGDLYVTSVGQVLVFTNIATANGNIAPARSITFPTNYMGGNSLAIALDTSR